MMSKRFLSLILLATFVSGAWAQVPRSKHVVVVTLENHSYEQVVGNSQMPYFNSLIAKYAIADRYYATMHNSLSALMWLVAGQTVTTNDNTLLFFNVDNIVRQMQKDGRTWKSYQSNLPSVGYLGFNTGLYVKRHNPLAYFTDVESSLRNNIVPSIPYLQNDIAHGTLPEYSYVTPNMDEDALNGTLAQADTWLKGNIPQLLASPQFQQDGILFIVWDEGSLSPIDRRGTGGRVATLVIGPSVKPGYHSTVLYDHQSLLHSACLALGLSGCPGGGATGVPMDDFFQSGAPSGLHVNLISPATNNVTGTLQIAAQGVSGANAVTGMAAYVGSTEVARSYNASLNASIPLAAGSYTLVVRAWDSTGQYSDVRRTITVASPGLSVNLISPATTSVSGPLQIEATGVSGKNPASGMRAYVNGAVVAVTTAPRLSASVPLSAGSYTVVVRVWDTIGNYADTTRTVQIQ
jgi:acid phosphatase